MNLNLLDQSSSELLNLIDWDLLIHDIASGAYFEQTKQKIMKYPRATAPQELREIHQVIEKFIEKYHSNDHDNFYIQINNIPATHKIKDQIFLLDKGSVLTIQDIHRFVLLLEVFHQQHKFFGELFGTKNMHSDEIGLILKSLIRPFRRFVDSDGEIDYSSHPVLGELYQKRAKIDNKANKKLREIINDWKSQDILQIDTYDIIQGHFVLIVKTDHYNSSLGSIIARSDSGQTLYIEPSQLSAFSFEHKKLTLEIEKEIFQICVKYSDILRSVVPTIQRALDLITEVDYYFCLAQYAIQKNLIKPKLINEKKIKLEGFFHPLIDDPVKNDLNLLANHEGLIISGPNTGGKTVTLKTLCLVQLFLNKGFYIPAHYAELSVFKEVYFLSLDHQNLTDGLSSFGAETMHYLSLTEQLGDNALIFIDEIFNSTSSEEASALAISFFDFFYQKANPMLFVSTHHQMLKVKTHESKQFLSAHMGFDPDNLIPTYKLSVGTPGSSMALETFERISKQYQFADQIKQKARSILDSKYQEYEKLLFEVSQKKAKFEKEYLKYEELNKTLKNQAQSQEGVLKLKADKEYEKLKIEINSIRRQALETLKEVKEKQNSSEKSIRKAFYKIDDQLPTEEFEKPDAQKINHDPEIGERCLFIPLNREGEVVKINEKRKKVTLLMKGNMKIEAKFSELGKPRSSAQKQDFQFQVQKTKETSLKVDGRGMRLDEFKEKVEFALSDVMLGEIPFVEIIHGHGDGILKNWLREHLKLHPDLRFEIPKESQDGVTVVRLS